MAHFKPKVFRPLYEVGKHEKGGYYVYPYTNPPDEVGLSKAARIPSMEAAQQYADRLNTAVNRYVREVLDGAMGAIVSDLCIFAAMPGSPESETARAWLFSLAQNMIAVPPAVALGAHFQSHLENARLVGVGEERLDRFLQECRLVPRNAGGILSLN